jgi:xanthine dehydrogenase FAD-binding subunit
VIENAGGRCQVPLKEFFLSPGISILKDDEILTGFLLPLCGEGQASSFHRIMRPQGVALPILNCAVWVERCGDLITNTRIAIGPGGATPFRAVSTETLLTGKPYSLETMNEAVKAILKEANFRTSARRATREYRRHIVLDLFRATFSTAWDRATLVS